MPMKARLGLLVLKTCWYSPGILLLTPCRSGRNGTLKSYPVANSTTSTSSTDDPFKNVMRPESGLKDSICGLTMTWGCVKAASVNSGFGFRKDEMTGSLETSRMSWTASKADIEPPTTTTLWQNLVN